MNICNKEKPSNPLNTYLTSKTFKQIVPSATHIDGGHIDHCYTMNKENHEENQLLKLFQNIIVTMTHFVFLGRKVPSLNDEALKNLDYGRRKKLMLTMFLTFKMLGQILKISWGGWPNLVQGVRQQ